LVDSRTGIIESKQNDGKIISKKNKKWENIGKEFNSRHGVHKRSFITLASLYKQYVKFTSANKVQEIQRQFM
jgi:hypothetical protein